MKKIKLIIEGMHCSSCASNIERSLKKVKGIEDANVSLMLKKGSVQVEDSTEVSEADLRAAVERAGYKLVRVE